MNLLELEQAVNTNKQNIDFDALKSELSKLEAKLQTPEVWSNQNLASELGQKSREIKETLEMFARWDLIIEDAKTAREIGDEELIKESDVQLGQLEKELDKYDFEKMLYSCSFNFCKPSFPVLQKSASICSDCTLRLIKAHSSLSSSIIKILFMA